MYEFQQIIQQWWWCGSNNKDNNISIIEEEEEKEKSVSRSGEWTSRIESNRIESSLSGVCCDMTWRDILNLLLDARNGTMNNYQKENYEHDYNSNPLSLYSNQGQYKNWRRERRSRYGFVIAADDELLPTNVCISFVSCESYTYHGTKNCFVWVIHISWNEEASYLSRH